MSSGIDHLIINSPYKEPRQHWEYNHHRMAFELAAGRRPSGYTIASTEKRLINDPGVFVQIPLVNKVRGRVKEWRENGYAGISGITKNLLEHWYNKDERTNRFFFCQLEAIETLIWLAEAPDASKVGIDIPSDGGDLTRICSKMATGTGKTILMAMLIAWQSLNKINYLNKKGYAKDFLIIAPNLTVRSRLSVLLPAGEENYYDAFNIVPLGLREQLRQAKVVIRNWHALAWDTEEKLKKKRSVDKRGAKSDEAYAREVLGELANSKNFIVINDEAHHAWRIPAGAKLSRDEKKEAEEATIWIGGLDRLNRARGIQTVYDFSATPFTPSGKNSSSENLFGWIVSDFGLTEAIESGLVKTPRVVIRDDGQLAADYRSKFYHLYNDPEVKPSLNKKGAEESEALPPLVENAYALLGKDWREWAQAWRDSGSIVPPVMISVANQTETAARIKYAFDHENILIPELCNPAKTLHIDSKVLEAAETFAEEEAVTETKSTDEDVEAEPTRKLSKKEQAQRLRQTVDTIGKVGELGEQIQHVISVGMLTEGWDAKTVTHIMGLRAFSSQLLCEQVVGRGLRRTSYDLDEKGFFTPEYVNIFGVPFAFMPHESPKDSEAKPSVQKQRIQPLVEKVEFEIRFPNVMRIENKFKPVLKLDLNKVDSLTLNAYDTREIAELAPVIDGKHDVTRLSEIDLEQIYSQVRLQSSIFRATLDIFKQIQVDWKGDPNALFTQIIPVVENFIASDKLQISPPMFGLEDKRKRVLVRLNAAKIVNHLAPFIQQENVESYELIVNTNKPIISTNDMKVWDTSKPFVHTRKSHINFCVCDSRWESTTALHLDRSEHVTAWVKNDHLGLEIRYLFNGGEHKYRPDFLAKLANDEMLVIETKGEEDQKDKVKREAMREWIRAVNQHGGFGRWHSDPAVSKRPDDIPEILERSVRNSQATYKSPGQWYSTYPTENPSDHEHPGTYTVRAGDTLSKISREFYRDSDRYIDIFHANRDQLNNLDDIKAGTSLIIPPPLEVVENASSTTKELVSCTAFGPPKVCVGEQFMLQVYAHLQEHTQAVKRLAFEFDESAKRISTKALDQELERKSKLIFHLIVPGLEVDDPIQSLIWRGTPEAVQFGISVPSHHKLGTVIGKIIVSINTVPIGHLNFKVSIVSTMIEATEDPGVKARGDLTRYKKAFISYASEDRNEVLKRVQMLSLNHIEYFHDLLSLEPGERWEMALYRHIDESDVFYLFWSKAAKRSSWVMKEVQYALAKQGGDDSAPPAILPVIIEGPPPIAPPPELSHLHFNDSLIYFMVTEKD